MQKNNRAQGAIEYLLIIGAAILVVAVVVVAITSVTGAGKTDANITVNDYNSQLNALRNSTGSTGGSTMACSGTPTSPNGNSCDGFFFDQASCEAFSGHGGKCTWNATDTFCDGGGMICSAQASVAACTAINGCTWS